MPYLIPIATLIKGTEILVGDGITRPIRALVKIAGGPPISAIVKRLPKNSIAAECIAAVLLRGWQVPVSDPMLILDGGDLLFGSKEEYPSLKQSLGLQAGLPPEAVLPLVTVAAEILCRFAETPKAIVADEAIENWDRNLANILWDGGSLSFIDHERAFGIGEALNFNKLADLILLAAEGKGVSRSAVAAALTLPAMTPIQFPEGFDLDASAFAAQVSARIPNLAANVLKRFPEPNDLFSQSKP